MSLEIDIAVVAIASALVACGKTHLCAFGVDWQKQCGGGGASPSGALMPCDPVPFCMPR